MLDNILFQYFIQVCFYFLGKKTGGARAPLAPPLATALGLVSIGIVINVVTGGFSGEGLKGLAYLTVQLKVSDNSRLSGYSFAD